MKRDQEGITSPLSTFFVGNVDAAECRLGLLTGLKRPQEESRFLEVSSLIIDTTGFVDKAAGGLALKQYKVELLQPDMVLALQNRRELEPVLAPLRKHPRIRVRDLFPGAEVRKKSRERGIHTRRKKLQHYFREAEEIVLQFPN